MRILRKYLWLIVLIPLLSACAIAQERTDSADDCNRARIGELSTDERVFDNPAENAFLFDCAVSVTISGPGESREARSGVRARKRALADFLLSRALDTGYVNADGDTLLMSVVISFLPLEWKMKTAQHLIDQGVDVNHKSHDGNSASDYAQHKGDRAIIRLLADSARAP